jgi:hypothetical protein
VCSLNVGWHVRLKRHAVHAGLLAAMIRSMLALFYLRVCLDPTERERERAKFLHFCTFFALLDPNTPKCKRANATVILLIMD